MNFSRTPAARQTGEEAMHRNPEVIPAGIASQPPAESANGSNQNSIYEDVVAESPQAVLVVDGECRILFSNAKAAEMVGKVPEDLAGRAIGEWRGFPAEEMQSACTRVVKDRQPSTFEHRNERGDWFEVHFRPCRAGVAIFFGNI